MQPRWLTFFLLGFSLLAWPLAGWSQGIRSTTTINTLPNDTTTGTALNKLAKVVSCSTCGGVGKLVTAALTDTAIDLFPIQANAGTTGSALYVKVGDAQCEFDNTTTNKAGSFVVASTLAGNAGRCHQQDTAPATGMVVGKLLSDNTTAGQPARIDVQNINYSPGTVTGTGTVTSIGLNAGAPEFTIATTSTNPITVSGTFTINKATQSANMVWAGPVSGAAAAPTFRQLQPQDVAALTIPPGGTAGGTDISGTYPNTIVVRQASTNFALGPTGTTAASFSGTATDYTGCPTVSCMIDTGTTGGDRILASLSTSGVVNGDLKQVCNVGAGTNALILSNENQTGTTASMRLRLTASTDVASDDMTLYPWQCATLRYAVNFVSATSRWMLLHQAVPDYLRYRSVGVIVGDPDTNSPTLVVGNNTPNAITNDLGRPLRILELACKSDLGSSTINVFQAGTTTSLLANPPCSCANNVWTNCALSATAANVTLTSFTPNITCPAGAFCAVDVNTVGVDNQTKYYVLKGKAILQ